MTTLRAIPQTWHALDVTVENEAHEAVEYALMEAGALGTEAKETTGSLSVVTGYFEVSPDRERVRSEMVEALRIYSLPTSAARDLTLRQIANRDWLAEWKKDWQPVPVGTRFLIAPPWSQIPSSEQRIVIRIEPGMAFGTGTHETTRLCLEAIEKHFSGGSFLDVGTGTGILAIAAAKLSPNLHIEACDIDGDAVQIAKENARINGVADQIRFCVGGLEATSASVDCVCANLTADAIVELMPSLISMTCGRLICSGILTTQVESVIDAIRQLGVSNPLETTFAGEWACAVV